MPASNLPSVLDVDSLGAVSAQGLSSHPVISGCLGRGLDGWAQGRASFSRIYLLGSHLSRKYCHGHTALAVIP